MSEEKKEVQKQNTKLEEKKAEVKKEDVKKTDASKSKEVKAKDSKKKFEAAKGEKKKTNYGVIIAIIAVVVVIVAIAVYCVINMNSPEKAVESMLKEIKEGSFAQNILASVLEEDFDQETQKLLFERLEWKILNVTQDGDKATVEVEITNKDFKTIIGNYMQKMIKVAFTGQQLNEEEMTNYLMEELANSEIQNVTSKQSMIVEKKNGKWEVSQENDFATILLPGFMEAINSVGN